MRIILPISWLLSFIILSTGCKHVPEATVASSETIRQTISTNTAPLLLVHAWATWCHPCREEFPELVRLANDRGPAGLEVLLVSADDPADLQAVQTFLEEHNSPVGSLVSTKLDRAFMESLSPNWAGTLPASFFYADGKLVAEWEGKGSYEQYIEQVDRLLNP